MDDFEYQLQQMAVEQQKKMNESSDDGSTSNPYIYKDPTDGTEYEWDHNKKAWFPKFSDDFLAQYQSSYGSQFENQQKTNESDSQRNKTTELNIEPKPQSSKAGDQPLSNIDEQNRSIQRKRPAKDEPPQWFEMDDEHNTNVYVSNLPLDITEDEFITLMKKCGLIMKDDRGQLKIKLYLDEHGKPKGDGRCCYIKVESVQLALNILDGYVHRDHTIKVERAKFSLKGEYDPSLKPKKKKSNKRDKEKQKKRLEKLFDWRPDKLPGERPKWEKVVVIKNMFDVKMFETDPKLILEYKADLREECEEKCGPVKKVEIYDLHPEGVATVTFNEFEHSDQCVELMNGRFFAGRKLDAQLWDGKTKYKIQETEQEIEERIKKWDQFLENDDCDSAQKPEH